MGRRNTRKSRNVKQLKIRYALFTEGLVTERQYLELLRQHLRPRMQLFRSNLSAKILREYSPSTSKRSDAAISTKRFSSLMLISIKSLMRFCGNVSLLLPLMQSLPTHASNYGCCGIPLTDERIRKLATASDSRAATVSRGTRTSPQGSRLLASPRPSNEHNKPGRPSCRTRRARTLPRPCPGSST